MEAGTGQSQSTISQHLMRLKAAGVVRCERSGNEMYYEVSDPDAANLVAALFGDEREDYNCTTLPSSEAARQEWRLHTSSEKAVWKLRYLRQKNL